MDTLFIGYSDGLVRAEVDGAVEATWVMNGAPVPMVALDPLEPERVYAATLGEGLWRSDDGGRGFEHLASIDGELIWSVAVSTSDRRGDLGTVYAGTQMSALYRSADGGDSFEELTSVQEIPSLPEWSFPPAPDTHHVHQIALDIDDPDTVVFGVELGGVYLSRDAGETWVRTHADPDPHTLRTHPSDPGHMYEGGGASYYESRDAGATWQRSLDGIPDDVRYFYSLAVDSGDPGTVVLSGARDPFTGHGVIPGMPIWSTLYRRVAGGAWEEITDGTPPPDGTAMGTLAAGSAGVFYYVTEPGEIYRSTDGAKSFARLGYGNRDARGKKARSVAIVSD